MNDKYFLNLIEENKITIFKENSTDIKRLKK